MTQFLAKMTNFRESWLPQFLEDFQNLQTEEKEETIKALVSALGKYCPESRSRFKYYLNSKFFRNLVFFRAGGSSETFGVQNSNRRAESYPSL